MSIQQLRSGIAASGRWDGMDDTDFTPTSNAAQAAHALPAERRLVVVAGIRHRYDTREVLRIDHWSVGLRERWLILGPSGSGKSTLLHIVAGIVTPTAGKVSVAGQDLAAMRPSSLDRFRGRNIGIVFQRLHLIPSLTVLENLLLAQYLAGLTADPIAAAGLLAELDLDRAADKRPHALSVGEAQRAAVARAVVNRPGLLLADEPTSNLDDANADAALQLLLGRAAACEAALVVVTHDRRVRERFEHRIELESAA